MQELEEENKTLRYKICYKKPNTKNQETSKRHVSTAASQPAPFPFVSMVGYNPKILGKLRRIVDARYFLGGFPLGCFFDDFPL